MTRTSRLEAVAGRPEARLGQPMTAERLAWFRELTQEEPQRGLRIVPAETMKELVDEIVRLRRRDALDRLALESQKLGLPY